LVLALGHRAGGAVSDAHNQILAVGIDVACQGKNVSWEQLPRAAGRLDRKPLGRFGLGPQTRRPLAGLEDVAQFCRTVLAAGAHPIAMTRVTAGILEDLEITVHAADKWMGYLPDGHAG